MLTPRQRQLLGFINERIRADGVCPTYEEMRMEMGGLAKSAIHRLILALEQRGFIRRIPYGHRAIEVIRMPETRAQQIDGYWAWAPTNPEGRIIPGMVASTPKGALGLYQTVTPGSGVVRVRVTRAE